MKPHRHYARNQAICQHVQDEDLEPKRWTQTPRSTVANRQVAPSAKPPASNSLVAKFDARYRGQHAKLTADQLQNAEFDVDFPNFDESGVVLEEVVCCGARDTHIGAWTCMGARADCHNSIGRVLQVLMY